MTAATDKIDALVADLVAQMDVTEKHAFLWVLKKMAGAKSKGWATRHLRNFEKWYRERRGIN